MITKCTTDRGDIIFVDATELELARQFQLPRVVRRWKNGDEMRKKGWTIADTVRTDSLHTVQ